MESSSSRMGGFGDESSSMSEAPLANPDYYSANEAEHNDDGFNQAEEEEESSWTTYIVDFLINGQDQEKTTLSSPLPRETPPSSAVLSDYLGLKRRKNKGSSVGRVDDALEDTASSPINTPKVEETGVKSELTEDEGIGHGERAVVVGSGRGGGDSRLLKERGLCLVPLSMAVNYLG